MCDLERTAFSMSFKFYCKDSDKDAQFFMTKCQLDVGA